MNLEKNIKDIITQKLEDGTVERLIAEQVEKGIEKALGEIFGSWGSATKVIRGQVESVVLPYLEGYDYSNYVTKLDAVLVDVLKAATTEHNTLLSNFKELISPIEDKTISISALFERWNKYVAQNAKTDGLKINFDDGPRYDSICTTSEFIENEKPRWSIRSTARLVFECEHDEEMNFEIHLSKWDSSPRDEWGIEASSVVDINALRHLNELDVYIMALKQNGVKIVVDECSIEDDVTLDAVPEATFN